MATPISAQLVQKLREATGGALMDCKRALEESECDFEKAKDLLRIKGLKTAEKKAGRVASQGAIGQYLHHDGKKAVLVEVNCETDFVARNDKFKEFARLLAMHILSAKPRWVRKEEVPADAVAKEQAMIAAESADEMAKKPEAARAKIIEGRMQKYYAQHCLLEQPWIMDDKRKVEEFRKDLVAAIGENVTIGRFSRIEVGGVGE
ncbi:MAG: translation elongation factor Ts [Planctomycetes bacterium]|nr:translation elongation factor Ts [Planctomycetota bacterium]